MHIIGATAHPGGLDYSRRACLWYSALYPVKVVIAVMLPFRGVIAVLERRPSVSRVSCPGHILLMSW